MKIRSRIALLVCVLGCWPASWAQTIRISCPLFFDDANQRIACVEALLEQNGYHFTLASLPTSNGFGPGLVLTHTIRGTANGQELDLSATGAVTTNSSWFSGGDLTWTLPFHSSDTSTSERDLASASTKNWHATALHLNASHRTVRTLYFYGLGSRSPDTPYVYAEDDTWGEVDGRLPLARALVVVGESKLEATSLPWISDASAVATNIPTEETPGIGQQPVYLDSTLGFESRVYKLLRQPFEPLPVGSPHLQPYWKLELDNDAAMHWQHPADGSPFAFLQFRFDGDERLNLRGVLRNAFVATQHPFVFHAICQDQNKQTDDCNLLQFDVKSRLILSSTSNNNQVPFYLEPTLGGNDIDNNVTLRGWDDYRFRDRDAALLQFESNYLLWDPFGVYVFYDAGTVGNQPGDLALPNFRQDAGAGLSVRVQGSIVAQTYYAWGRGNGGRWSYNFAKVF